MYGWAVSRWFALVLLLPALVPAPAAASPVFTDVSEAVGISGPLYNSYVHAGAWGDADGNGWPDLFAGTFEQGPTVVLDQLLLNDGGQFVDADQPAVELAGRAAAAVFADLDGDGDDDLVVSNNKKNAGSGAVLEPSHLLRNDGGVFVDVTVGSGLEAQSSNGRQIGVFDYNADGRLDLFIVADYFSGGGPTVLLRNDGDLRFTDVTSSAGIPTDIRGLGLAIGDATGDGWPDVFVAGGPLQTDPNRNYLLVAEGDGTYRPVVDHGLDWTPFATGSEDWVSSGAFGDVDLDGDLDLLVGHHFGSAADQGDGVPIRLYLNQGTNGRGDPIFADVTATVGLPAIDSKAPHVEIQDFDNDGLPDLFVSVTSGGQPVIFSGTGVVDGVPRFQIPSVADPHYYPVGPVADFDRDGDLDVFLGEFRSVNQGGPNDEGVVPSLLLANGAAGNRWLDVRIDDAGDGIGTVIAVYLAGHAGDPNHLIGWREIQLGSGFSSAGLPVAPFGLGAETTVDLVATAPHGGATTVHTGVATNQELVLGDSPPPTGAPDTWWPLDEPAGATVIDATGGGLDGTLVGAVSRISGRLGGAVALSGKGERIEVPAAALDGADQLTVAVWFSTTSSGTQALVGGAGDGDRDAIDVQVRRGKTIDVTPGDGGRRLSWRVTNVADGAWHHLAVVRDVGDGITLYLDGVSQGRKAAQLAAVAVTTVGFGADQTVPGVFSNRRSWVGNIDEIRIYLRTLTASEIADLANP